MSWIPRALRLVLLLALCAPAARAEAVRVATYNVQNYLCMDRRMEGRFMPGHPKPEREKAAVRAAIREVRPDVLCLQEIGAKPFLEELRQDLAREGLHYPHSAWLQAVDTVRHVAVLSRLPLREVTPHAAVPWRHREREGRVKRGVLEVAFDGPGGPWRVFVVHLKSPLTEDPVDPGAEQQRTAEARAVRDLILGRAGEPGARFLIVGDFNASPDSRALAAFAARGERRIATAVRAVDSRGETWTRRHVPSDRYDRVDYILASPALVPGVRGGRGMIHDAPGAMDGSDHRLVWVDLDLAGAAPETPTPAGAGPAGVAETE